MKRLEPSQGNTFFTLEDVKKTPPSMLVAAASGLPFYCSYIFKSDERVAWRSAPENSHVFQGDPGKTSQNVPKHYPYLHYIPLYSIIFHSFPSQFIPIKIPSIISVTHGEPPGMPLYIPLISPLNHVKFPKIHMFIIPILCVSLYIYI